MRQLFFIVTLWVSGCQCQAPSLLDGGMDAGVAYDEFDAWREMREVIRKSPDAVPARAEALVAAKDAQGLFALVRDDIALLPTTNHGLEQASTLIRWGARATLRGQAGTPRERAELLKELYIRAGFTAEVVVGAPIAGSTVMGLLAKGPQRALSYQVTAEQAARWKTVLSVDPKRAPPAPLDEDGGVRSAILAQIRPLLPTPPAAVAFDPTLDEVPLVRVVINGSIQYANPNLDNTTFGSSFTMETPVIALAPLKERQLRVALSAARSANPGETFILAEHTWNASDVAGRTVTAAFNAPLSRAEAGKLRVGEADAFIPVFVVRGDGLDAAGTQALSVVGTPVLRDGTRVMATMDGGLTLAGEAIARGPTSAATLTSVTTVSVTANAQAFPDIELWVSAKKSDGTRVSALASDAFRIQEDGKNVSASLRRTSAGAPRVVLLFDRSTSIPAEFVTGAATIGHSIADAVITQFPGAQLQVAALDINGPAVSGPMVSTLADVDAQLAALSGTGSEVWTALDHFADSRATCILAITDAVIDGVLSPQMATRLVSGPSVLVAGVGAVDVAAAARIAEVTRGRVLQNVTPTNLAVSVTTFLAERLEFDYRIVYRAPTMGANPRRVTVSVRAPGTATANVSYVPPLAPVAGSALSALYLTIETDGHSVTRLLAGGAAGSAANREEVAGALFGKYVLGVEAGAPSLTTLLDEHLTERFQAEPGVDALRAGDAAAIAQAAKLTLFRSPTDLRFFSGARPGEAEPGNLTFADGLTVTLHATRPVLGVKVVRRFDMLPLVPRETVSFSGAQTKHTTTERTVFLAAFESERFPTNTARALAGKTLARFDPLTIDQTFGARWSGVAYPAYADYDVLAPSDGSVVAFWAVHRRTGEVIGVMPNGGIGEGESTQMLVDRLLTLLDAAGRAGEAIGYEGVKAWADLEATKVTLLGSAIMLFEGEGTVGDVAGAICGMGVGAIGGPIPGWEDLHRLPGDFESIFRTLMPGEERPSLPSATEVICSGLLGD